MHSRFIQHYDFNKPKGETDGCRVVSRDFGLLFAFHTQCHGKLTVFSEEQAEANAAGHENIRITMATYMFTEYNGDNIYKILFGNGLIVPNAGGVAKEFEMMQDEFGFFTSDVGYCFCISVLV